MTPRPMLAAATIRDAIASRTASQKTATLSREALVSADAVLGQRSRKGASGLVLFCCPVAGDLGAAWVSALLFLCRILIR